MYFYKMHSSFMLNGYEFFLKGRKYSDAKLVFFCKNKKKNENKSWLT